ncbi:MAG: hypothetical protein E6Q76_15765 [Rhizobium sp.]|nr:MAG: hypothetical protein E6Q76_15765 [Rhizobium sp.]
MDALETALNWSRAGWPVFPCREDGVPSIEGWQREATTDVAKIEAWAEEVEFERVGVVPGLVGCFVIDVDVKGGKDGEAALDALCAQCGFDDWEYPQQSTRSGGRHLFLRGTFRSSVSSLGAGLDTRGGDADGGLGFVYAYRPDPIGLPGDIPLAPDALLARSGAGRDRDENPQDALVELDQPANVARGRAYLRDLKAPREGERNLSVFKTACTLKDLGLSLATVFDLMEAHPHVTGDPPLCVEEVDEFNATVRSAYRNGQLSPGRDGVDGDRLAAAAVGYDVAAPGTGVVDAQLQQVQSRQMARFWGGLRDAHPPAWLLRGVLPACSTVGLYGPGGSFKSFVALDFLCHVATGAADWAERPFSLLGGPRPVVYVSGEGAVGPRLRAWEAKHGRSEALAENFLVCEAVDLGDQDDRSALKAEIDRLLAGRPPAVICFDTLARATPGQEENSNRDMGAIVKVLDGFKDAYQCCVMAIHHTPKANLEWRGATAVWNALDSALLLKRGNGTAASMILTRQKDAPTGQRWAISLKEYETGKVYDEDEGVPEKALAVESITPSSTEDDAVEQQDAEERIKQALRGQAAGAIVEASETDVDAEVLAKMLAADGSIPANTMLKWLRAVVVRGEGDPSHPMFSYLAEKKPLRFGKKR